MTLKIKGKGSESFYKEVISITGQYYQLIKNPEAKISDVFKKMKRLFILYIVVLAILVSEMILVRALLKSALVVFLISFVFFICILFYLTILSNNRKLKELLNAETEEQDITLDDEGIELSSRSQTIRYSWDILAFARIFNEAICFVPKKSTHAMLFVSRSVYDEIKPYIKCCIYGDNGVRSDGQAYKEGF